MNTIFRRILRSSQRLANDPNGFARESLINAKSSYKRLEQNFLVQLGEWSAKSWEDQGKIVGWNAFKLVNFAAVCHLFMEFVGAPHAMSGPSMWPTLGNSGEWVIENRISYLLRPNSIARGDLVTVSSPQNPRRIICKRVIGLPGDVICVDPTGVKAPSTEHVIVPKGHVWISGDNAKLSIDSRDYGPVSMALVRGKLSARIWPLSKLTIFRDPTTIIE